MTTRLTEKQVQLQAHFIASALGHSATTVGLSCDKISRKLMKNYMEGGGSRALGRNDVEKMDALLVRIEDGLKDLKVLERFLAGDVREEKA